MASVTHSAKLSQPKNGKRQSTGITSEPLLEILKLQKKFRGKESLQKAKTSLQAQKSHRHSALPQPPLFPSHFLGEIKAPGKSQVCKQKRSESQSEDLERLEQEMTLKISSQEGYPTSTETLAHLTSKREKKTCLKA